MADISILQADGLASMLGMAEPSAKQGASEGDTTTSEFKGLIDKMMAQLNPESQGSEAQAGHELLSMEAGTDTGSVPAKERGRKEEQGVRSDGVLPGVLESASVTAMLTPVIAVANQNVTVATGPEGTASQPVTLEPAVVTSQVTISPAVQSDHAQGIARPATEHVPEQKQASVPASAEYQPVTKASSPTVEMNPQPAVLAANPTSVDQGHDPHRQAVNAETHHMESKTEVGQTHRLSSEEYQGQAVHETPSDNQKHPVDAQAVKAETAPSPEARTSAVEAGIQQTVHTTDADPAVRQIVTSQVDSNRVQPEATREQVVAGKASTKTEASTRTDVNTKTEADVQETAQMQTEISQTDPMSQERPAVQIASSIEREPEQTQVLPPVHQEVAGSEMSSVSESGTAETPEIVRRPAAAVATVPIDGPMQDPKAVTNAVDNTIQVNMGDYHPQAKETAVEAATDSLQPQQAVCAEEALNVKEGQKSDAKTEVRTRASAVKNGGRLADRSEAVTSDSPVVENTFGISDALAATDEHVVAVDAEVDKHEPKPIEVKASAPDYSSTADAHGWQAVQNSSEARSSQAQPAEKSGHAASFTAMAHPATSARMIHQIVKTAKVRLLEGGAEITMRLDPPQLGAIRMSVSAQDGAVTANLQASNEVARQVLQADLPTLKQALLDAGINVDTINVSVGNNNAEQPWNFNRSFHDAQSGHGRQSGNSFGYGSTIIKGTTEASDASYARTGSSQLDFLA